MLFNNVLVEIFYIFFFSDLTLNDFLIACPFDFPCLFVQSKATQEFTLINLFLILCLFLFLFFCCTKQVLDSAFEFFFYLIGLDSHEIQDDDDI